jgi:hypothetical protein
VSVAAGSRPQPRAAPKALPVFSGLRAGKAVVVRAAWRPRLGVPRRAAAPG